jgi:drug/metabolite transporter (DMT)-like permease
MTTSSRTIGFIQIILSGICFGFLGVFGKLAYRSGITPGELLALRYSVSAIVTLVSILLTNRGSLLTLTKFEILSSLLLGIFGYALFSSLYFAALTGLSASLTVLLLYTYPLMVTIFSRILLKEKMRLPGQISLLLVSVGMVGLVKAEWSISNPKFIMFGLGSAFFYALYIIFSRKYLSQVNSLCSSFYVQLGAGGILFLLNYHENPKRAGEILQGHFPLIISMAFICSFMAMTLFLAGLQKIKSSEASILSMAEPISGVLIATIILHEKLEWIQIGGGFLILVGMLLVSLKEKYEQ